MNIVRCLKSIACLQESWCWMLDERTSICNWLSWHWSCGNVRVFRPLRCKHPGQIVEPLSMHGIRWGNRFMWLTGDVLYFIWGVTCVVVMLYIFLTFTAIVIILSFITLIFQLVQANESEIPLLHEYNGVAKESASSLEVGTFTSHLLTLGSCNSSSILISMFF